MGLSSTTRKKIKLTGSDPLTSASLILSAREDFLSLGFLPMEAHTASIHVRTAYDVIRMLCDAKLAADGYSAADHETAIQYCLETTCFSWQIAARLQELRSLRNDVLYRGKRATLEEAKEARALAEKLLHSFTDLPQPF